MVINFSRDTQRLAARFPGLENAAGVWPWNPNRLDIWAAEEASDATAVHAARLVLYIWNRNMDWQCGRFDMMEALDAWDQRHRKPFLEFLHRMTQVN